MHVERSDASDRWCGLVAPTMGAATTIDHGDGNGNGKRQTANGKQTILWAFAASMPMRASSLLRQPLA